MTEPCDERPQLDRVEEGPSGPAPTQSRQQFVARLAAHYVPKPMSPARRAAWEAALWARLQAPRRRIWLTPTLTTVAVAVMVTWLILPGLFMPVSRGGGEPHIGVIGMPSLAQWGYELIYPRELTGATERDDSAILPDDYRMIAQVFLDRE